MILQVRKESPGPPPRAPRSGCEVVIGELAEFESDVADNLERESASRSSRLGVVFNRRPLHRRGVWVHPSDPTAAKRRDLGSVMKKLAVRNSNLLLGWLGAVTALQRCVRARGKHMHTATTAAGVGVNTRYKADILTQVGRLPSIADRNNSHTRGPSQELGRLWRSHRFGSHCSLYWPTRQVKACAN